MVRKVTNMKKTAKIILATVAIAIMVMGILPSSDASSGTYTWYTNRDTVTATSYNMTGWINASIYYGDEVTSAGDNMVSNWSMPTKINETSNVTITIYNNGTAPAHANLTVNGNSELTNATTINAGSEQKVYLNVSSFTQNYINVTFNANSTDVFFNISVYWNNADVTDTSFITGSHHIISSIKERYKSSPIITFDKSDSWYTVEDKIVFDISYYSGFTVEFYNIYVKLSYPSDAINQPYKTINIDALTNSMTAQSYLIGYQKDGPYVSSTGTAQQDIYGNYNIGMRLKAYENEKDCSWTFNPSSSDLAQYFPSFDTTSLVIKIDGVTTDYTIGNDGSITIDNVDLDSGLTSVQFTWTPATSPVTPTTGGTHLSTGTLIVVAGVIILSIALVAVIVRSKH